MTRARVGEAWTRLDAAGRLQVAVLTLCVVGYLVHYLLYTVGARNWFIEDAGISFAYARNFIHGHGLVPYVGGGIEGWFPYVLALLFLLIRPEGLFGEKIIRRI
jgi:branched-subunit amino acid ABC-type transport system permease component